MESLETIVAKLAARLERHEHVDPSDRAPRAAVAAILRQEPAGAEVLFIERAEHPRDPWSGHVAFPGGRRDPTDASLLATVVRETREELGLELARAELVARLPDVPAPRTSATRPSLVVTPFVFALREPAALTPNEAEVADTLWVPLDAFARGHGKGTFRFTWEGREHEVPCFRLAPRERVLWGMTYRMLGTLFEALDAPID